MEWANIARKSTHELHDTAHSVSYAACAAAMHESGASVFARKHADLCQCKEDLAHRFLIDG